MATSFSEGLATSTKPAANAGEGVTSPLSTSTRQSSAPSTAEYATTRRKFFSLPWVVPGSIVHVRYHTQWKQFPLPQISMALPLGKDIPALFSTVQISVPKQSAFHWAFERMPPSDPVVRQTSYAATYSWTFTNVPAHRKEVLSPPLQTPRLLFSTFRDWGDFAGWYERISQLTGEVTPEIEVKAKALTTGCKSDREKLIALYNYIAATDDWSIAKQNLGNLRAAGRFPLSFADYPASPVPHSRDRNVLLLLMALIIGTTVTAFILVRRYSLKHPEELDRIVSDRSKFQCREEHSDWENVGFHRPLSGFLIALSIGLILFIMTLLINLIARFLIWRVTTGTQPERRA